MTMTIMIIIVIACRGNGDDGRRRINAKLEWNFMILKNSDKHIDYSINNNDKKVWLTMISTLMAIELAGAIVNTGTC